MSIIQALIEQVDAEVAKSPHSGRIRNLDLVIGRMSGVHVDSLRFAFEVLSPGTAVEGASLRIEQPRAQLLCQSCGGRKDIEQIEVQCPCCGGGDISIQGGQEMVLQSIELDDE